MSTFAEHTLRTTRRVEFVDITAEIRRDVRASGVAEGVCVVHVPHTTAAVTINENADPDVTRDMEKQLAEIVPPHHGYAHAEGNSDSHIKTTLTGPSLTLIVHGGDAVLGTWQGIYFCEYDGPRSRHFYTKCIAG